MIIGEEKVINYIFYNKMMDFFKLIYLISSSRNLIDGFD